MLFMIQVSRVPEGYQPALNGTPVCFDTSIKSLTTAATRGIPSFLRLASSRCSGSPGIKGPEVPFAGLVFRNTSIHSSILFLNSVTSMKPSISMAPKKWPIPLPTLRAGISWRSANGGAKGPQLAPLKTEVRISPFDHIIGIRA